MTRASTRIGSAETELVMAGLVPAIHVFLLDAKTWMDARLKAGHDNQ
jgi:hypothetical protein